jgi:L-ascorbate metabolism protein UlaG (beta-lactamase superfamily)
VWLLDRLRGAAIYVAGDTAFGSHFAQIREMFGSPRLALLPIGAYEPRWFMSAVHIGPDEAVEAHKILAGETSIAIHQWEVPTGG